MKIGIEVDIELDGGVIHTTNIEIDMSGSLFGINYLDGLHIRGEVDRQITSKIKTHWRYAQPYSESDKEFVSFMERSGIIDERPKSRRPRNKE